MNLNFFEGGVGGEALYEYIIYERGISEVCFNILCKGENLKVLRVFVSGKQSEFEYGYESDKLLKINLSKKQGAKKKIDIKVEFIFFNETKNNSDKNLNVFYFNNFYPTPSYIQKGSHLSTTYSDFLSPSNAKSCNFEVFLTIPSTFVLASGATACGIDINKEKTTYLLKINSAHNFSFSVSEKFNVISKKWGNKRVNYYFTQDNRAENNFELILLAFKNLFNKTKNYPYENFTVVQKEGDNCPFLSSAFIVISANEIKNLSKLLLN